MENGVVYFGSYSGRFYAVDAASGKLKWKFQTEGEKRFEGKHLHGSEPAAELMPDPFDFYLSSPALWGGAVYFGSGDGNVYALDAATGTLKWKFHTGDVVHASPAISDGTLFIGSWDSYFYALDAATGKEKWRFKTGEDHDIYNQVGIQSSAAVMDGVVYFGCRDSNFYALDARTGEKKWAFNNKGSWVITSPAVQDGKVYFATSDTAMVYAMDAKTGAPIFSLKFNHWPLFSSPAIAGGMLYIGSHQGKLIAIDLASQKPAWTFETDASRQNGPAAHQARWNSQLRGRVRRQFLREHGDRRQQDDERGRDSVVAGGSEQRDLRGQHRWIPVRTDVTVHKPRGCPVQARLGRGFCFVSC